MYYYYYYNYTHCAPGIMYVYIYTSDVYVKYYSFFPYRNGAKAGVPQMNRHQT